MRTMAINMTQAQTIKIKLYPSSEILGNADVLRIVVLVWWFLVVSVVVAWVVSAAWIWVLRSWTLSSVVCLVV